MMAPALELRNISKRFGGLRATNNVSLSVQAGTLHAIIGPNGAGKTTLINQIAGELRHDEGVILLDEVEIGALAPWKRTKQGLARTFQITQLLLDNTAEENVALAVQAKQGHSFRFFTSARKNPDAFAQATQLLGDVGLAAKATSPVSTLAHGERKQLELAVAIATGPSLLLLDEPMAGLSTVESQEMVALLRKLKERVTIVLVEHDMDAVFALADQITVLVYGRVIATGDGEAIRSNREVRSAYLGEGVD